MIQAFERKEKVVLLHGLLGSTYAMKKLERSLSKEGYAVTRIGYPSRTFRIEKLSEIVRQRITSISKSTRKVHIVAHSMGGIIVRYIQQYHPLENLSRVVMLSPPNNGSEIVDKLGHYRLLKWVYGPAFSQLGTSKKGWIRNTLGAVDFELGIITGDRNINVISSIIMPGKHDGRVSVASARVQGMKDFRIAPANHHFIINNKVALKETIAFLRSGSFETPQHNGTHSMGLPLNGN